MEKQIRKSANGRTSPTGLTATPPLPGDLPQIELTDNARQVLIRRYVRRGEDGKPAESVEEMFWRVAYNIAVVEERWDGDVMARARHFYELLTSKRFFPNSPTFTGAGTPLGQLAACFTAQMRVTTDQGVKPIVDLQVGDRVLTHEGRFRPVTETFQRAYEGDLLRIKIKLIKAELEVTPEHPILTPKGWIKAKDLSVGDKVAIGMPSGERPVPQFDLAESIYADELNVELSETAIRVRKPSVYQNSGRLANWNNRFIDVSPDFARLCGYYIAEGTIGPDERYVRFTFNTDETEYHRDVINLLSQIFGIEVNVSQSNFGNWVQINGYSRAIAAWFKEHFSCKSYGKRLPAWLLYASPEIQEAFLVGVLRGDGLYSEDQFRVKGRKTPKTIRNFRLTLSNPGLIQQIWQICLRLGYDASIRDVDTTYVTANASDTAQISMPPLQSRTLVKHAFGVDLPEPDPRYIRNSVSREGESVYFEIERIASEPYSGTVYNCEVDEDHSYVTEGVVVHNCFVLPITDDMGRDAAGIFTTLRNAALIQQTGGGNGFSFSRLRPKGALVSSSAGQATGPVGFLRVYDNAFGEIAQGGSRRGANMGVLRVDHPDVEEFITCKTDENAITNFNISVGITDAFMRAVEQDEDWDLVFPELNRPEYRTFSGTIEQARAAGIPLKVHKTVRARELFEKIVRQAHHNGEPGMLFLDAANRSNPVPHLYALESTNPCFVGSTRIATQHGLIPIQALAENGTHFLAATDDRAHGGEYGVAYRPALPAWKTRENAPVYRLVTKHGFEVTATADHRFLTADRGYVALGELQPGDRLLLQSQEGAWSTDERLPNVEAIQEKLAVMGQGGDRASGRLVTRQDFAAQYAHLPVTWSHDLGWVLGALVGDGWLSGSSHSPVGMVFENTDAETLEAFHRPMQEWFGAGHLHPRASVQQLTYGRLPYEFFKSLGLVEAPAHEKRAPESIWQAPREAVVGFLQGLFTTDGTVNRCESKRTCTVRLASASYGLLQDVQLLLSNFGILSRIHRRRAAGPRNLPDGKGGLRAYATHANYELLIDKANRDAFLQKIGFTNSEKQRKATQFVASKARKSNRETFETRVARIEPAGLADVYDFTEPVTHSLIANGLVAHNCGEQWLGPFENCCLGSVNLAQHFGPDGQVDWEKLRQSVVLSTIFLDDVVEANAYVPAVPQLKEAAHRARRIGLGIMGLADLMYHAGIRYGSPEGQEFGAQVMEFVRYHAMKTSVELAEARGAFPAIEGSIYDAQNFQWQPPTPIDAYRHDWGRPPVDWQTIVSGIQQHGIRNAAQTTIAPTGTIATVAGCEGYGCEPVFALAYIRHVNDNGKDLLLTYASPQFEQALDRLHIEPEKREAILEQIMREGSCQGVQDLPQAIRDTFVVSADISAEEHVRTQAAMQAFVDNSLSKTINFPPGAGEDEVAQAYLLAWKLGCKGITVYVTGSRDKVVLETHATAEKKQPREETPAPLPAEPKAAEQLHIWHEAKKPRPRYLPGYTYSIQTPLGEAFVTINENGHSQPFEIFVNTAKAGSDTAAVSEAIGRLISYVLRLASPVEPVERLAEVIRQLSGIGGGRSLGFGPNRVRSLPDGVAQVLNDYLEQWNERQEGEESGGRRESSGVIEIHAGVEQPPLFKIGDLCPECGQAAVVNEEGCRKCYACGFSEC